MDKEQERFLNELLNDFKIEASEHYQALVNGLVVLEKNEDTSIQQTTIETIFREVHSLKGASRAVNLLDIEKLCMSLENIFNGLKKGDSKLFPPMFEAFYKATDLLNLLLVDVSQHKKNSNNYNLTQVLKNLDFVHRNSLQTKKGNADEDKNNNMSGFRSVEKKEFENDTEQDITKDVQGLIENKAEDNPNILRKENETVRISTAKLNNLLQQSEEFISIKTSIEYFTQELQNINNQFALWNKKTSAESRILENSDSEKFIKEYLEVTKDFRKRHEEELVQLNKGMVQLQHTAGKMIEELLLDTKNTLLFPFSSILNLFPKIVRDLGKEYSKDIDITITGDNIEIDRRILEEIKDPLIHMIRNCIDHGIETEKERKIKGKSLKGKIEIKIIQTIDRKIELHIGDDGAGIDKTKIINSALKANIIKPDEIEKLSDKEIYAMIFRSGLSTSTFVTDISGRGIGMAIVAEKVNKLGGTIEFETFKGVGTSFIISLPQTLATFRGVMIKIAEQHFIIPSSAVEKALRIKYADIRTVESRKTICYNNETIALVLLSDVLKVSAPKTKSNSDDYLHLLIINSYQKKMAFAVDHILDEQEGIVKDLGLQLSHVNNIAGATILGNGKVVPILHPAQLIDSAMNKGASANYSSENPGTKENSMQKSILIAEDSITIRTLLRNFIESAGYLVKTAVDGSEAYNFLQNESFDLVVSDIEMPKMNGFQLTTKIREDKRYADLPVILVTALETQDDKQRGMDVGANAYIVKSSFEKSNLIETIQQLI